MECAAAIDEILRVTSAVLLLGNVRFNDSEPLEDAQLQDEQPLADVAELLQVDLGLLR